MTPDRLSVIAAEYAKGHGAGKRAARILGISHATVRQIASKHGIYQRNRARMYAVIAAEYARGMGAGKRAAKILGIKERSVWGFAYEHGIKGKRCRRK